jgi:hypothetical protein
MDRIGAAIASTTAIGPATMNSTFSLINVGFSVSILLLLFLILLRTLRRMDLFEGVRNQRRNQLPVKLVTQ